MMKQIIKICKVDGKYLVLKFKEKYNLKVFSTIHLVRIKRF